MIDFGITFWCVFHLCGLSWATLGRTFAKMFAQLRSNTIFNEIWCPRPPQEVSLRHGRRPSGAEGKQTFHRKSEQTVWEGCRFCKSASVHASAGGGFCTETMKFRYSACEVYFTG